MRALQRRREEDRERAPEDRRYRTLSLQTFKHLCEETGQVSDPVQFLQFLHNAGVVFMQEGLFQNQVILDQAWVLDAVYAVFHREKCLDFLKRHHGRFTLGDLGMLLWDAEGYSRKDQELFLSYMRSCGICFALREGSENIETIYVAPDHLPNDWELEARQERWGRAAPDAELTFTYESLPPALMRNLIGRVGSEAGLSCDYWRNGFYGYESRCDARVLVEQEMDDRWQGKVRILARGGRPGELVAEMERLLVEEERRLGLTSERQGDERVARVPDREKPGGDKVTAALAFAPEPREDRTFYVSYAWEDASSNVVAQFCERAKERGVTVRRDKDNVAFGDSISTFMHRLAQGDRVIVVLSEKYLRSHFCMHELYKIWVQARQDEKRFRKRVRVFAQKDVSIKTILDRISHAEHWEAEFTRYAAIDGKRLLRAAAKDFDRIKLMREFASHVGDILCHVEDTLRPGTLDDLVDFTFDGGDFDG